MSFFRMLLCFALFACMISELFGQNHGDYLSAEKLYKEKNYEACLSALEDVLKIYPDYPDSTIAATYKLRGDLYLKDFDLKNTLLQYEVADSLYAIYGNKHFHERLVLANKSGICYAQQDNLIMTAEFFQKEYDIAIQNYALDDLTVGKSTNNLAAVYLYLGDYDRSLAYFFQSEKIKKKFEVENPIPLANTYENISTIYGQINQMGEAERYLQKAGHLYERDKEAGVEALFPYYNNMATFYLEVERIDEAIAELDKASELPENFKANKLGVLIQQKLYGDAYFQNKEYDKSLSYYQTAERLIKKYDVGQKELGVMHTQMAYIYSEKGDKKRSIQNLEKARSEMLPLYGKTHKNYLTLLQSQIYILLKMNELQSASELLSDFEASLARRNQAQPKDLLFSNLQMGLFSSELNYELSKFKNSAQTNDLEKAITSAVKTIDYQDEVLKTISDKDSKLYFFRNAYENISVAVFLYLQKYEQTKEDKFLEQAFLLSEKAKYYTWQEARGVRMPDLESNIPQELIDQEKRVKVELNQKLSKYETQLDAETDPNSMLDLIGDIDSLKTIHQKSVTDLKVASPVLGRYLNNEASIDVAAAKLKLSSLDRSYISYFLNSNDLLEEDYAFQISQDNLGYTKLQTTELKQEIESLISALVLDVNSSSFEQDQGLYLKPATNLYDILISPLPLDMESGLIFNLHQELNSIPLEVLNNRANNNFLAQLNSVSYTNSLQSFLESEHISYDKNLLSSAPSFRSDEKLGLDSLLFNKKEIAEIESILDIKSDALVNSKTEFQNKIEQHKFNIVHLATHASANQKRGYQSYLAFGNEDEDLLYSREIYGLPIYSNLVVMSACETGDGELIEIQGVLGLTSAFAATATQSIVASLWQVNDATSKQIMTNFYQGLKMGKAKDVAMQEAKLDYLSSVPKSKQHPYYWAGFIQYGAIDPLIFENDSNASLAWYGFLMLIFSVLAYLTFKFLSKKKPLHKNEAA